MRFRDVKQMLVGRGYWEPQGGEGGEGSGGGAGAEGAGAGNAGGAGSGAGKEGGAGGQGGTGDPAPAGSKKPTDTEAALLREVMDKKEKLKAKDAELAAATARLAEFDGLDAKELRELVKAKKDAEIAQLEAKGQWDALKAQMVEQHNAELKAREDKVSAAEQRNAELAGQIAELTVGNAFGTSKFIAEELTLSVAKARRVYGGHFEFQNGQVVAFDKPAGAKERHVLVDAKGEPLGFDAALAKLVDADPDKDSLMKSKLKAGAGSNTNPAAVPGAKPTKVVDRSARAKISAGLAKAGLSK